ncbi:MAG: ABC transporter ATP-binding protein [Candidatus Sulfobium sp.]|jgi:putative ABC transport system ATP-binding protein
MIELKDVEKYYAATHVLRGVNLIVEDGDFMAVSGSSGSGKSTLLNLIGGMDRPERGTIEVGGEMISSYADEHLTRYRREKIGFIFQFFNLLPNLTVFENIEMPLLLKGGENNENVRSFILRVGLEGKEQRYPYQLSGGEQQRVAIARALVHDPELILADEPTGSLDSRTGHMIMELIGQLAEETNKTVILVTHEQNIAAFARRNVELKDGVVSPLILEG